MSLQRLTKVDANLKPSVINHKNVSKPEVTLHKCKYIGIQLMNTEFIYINWMHVYAHACQCNAVMQIIAN